MKATRLTIANFVLIDPRAFGGDCDPCFDSFNLAQLEEAIEHIDTFMEDKHSRNAKTEFRSMYPHTQRPQGKLMRVVIGEVFDNAVDLRKSPSTFGKRLGEIFSIDHKQQIWVQEAISHGLAMLLDNAESLYKTTDCYASEHECSIGWDALSSASSDLSTASQSYRPKTTKAKLSQKRSTLHDF